MSKVELDQLRNRGYRITPQRMAILAVLQDSGRHMTPLEIYDQISSVTPGVTEATVYRTLSFLVEQGLVLVAHMGNGQMVYEIAGHDHHHLICRQCGQTTEIDHQALESLYRQFQDLTGYWIDSVHVTFFGLCPHCRPES